MKGDFSNDTFDATKHYSSVRMQQGRVQLDSDWNQQMDIIAHRIETETTDFIGGPGAPTGNPGYGISISNNTAIKIGKGRYYVNGFLCENETDNLDFLQQPDYPIVSFASAGVTHDGNYLAYLDVWQRSVMAVDDLSLLEPALSGIDTTTRVQNIAQVKLLYNPNDLDPNSLLNTLQPGIGTGTLTPVLTTGANLQNQLYRIEVHQAGADGAATFKWSRDNGAIVARIKAVDINTNTITLDATAFNQQKNPFAVNQWVELSNQSLDLLGQPGTIVQITGINQNQIIVNVTGGIDISGFGAGSTLRLWDISNSTGITIIAGNSIALENGLSVEFSAGQYNTGDYWLIPSRATYNTIEWPAAPNGFAAKSPQGIQHSYAPLASLAATNTATNPNWTMVQGARTLFDPLATIYSKYLVPVGTVFPFAGIINSDANVPPGYLLCDGRSLNGADPQYQALFGVISHTYGGSNQTFNLPDLRGCFPLGAGHNPNLSPRALGARGGSERSQLLQHTHTYQDTLWSENPYGYNTKANFPDGSSITIRNELFNSVTGARQPGADSPTDNDGNQSYTYNDNTGVTGTVTPATPDTNIPPYLALNFIIKY